MPSFSEPSKEDCETLAREWKPHFEKPNFGPHDPPEPLVLSDEFAVPTSVNRYLAPDQQGECQEGGLSRPSYLSHLM